MEIFAHRGVHSKSIVANSLEAIQNAVAHRVFGLEVDVQVTKDQQLVIFHDDYLFDYTANAVSIAELTLNEIKEISQLMPDKYGTICTLDDVLIVCPESILLNIELKSKKYFSHQIADLAYALIQRYSRVNYIISSFNILTLKRYSILDKSVMLAFIVAVKIPKISLIIQILKLKISAIHIHKKLVLNDYYLRLKQLNLPLRAYTIYNIDEYHIMCNYGINGIFSDVLIE